MANECVSRALEIQFYISGAEITLVENLVVRGSEAAYQSISWLTAFEIKNLISSLKQIPFQIHRVLSESLGQYISSLRSPTCWTTEEIRLMWHMSGDCYGL